MIRQFQLILLVLVSIAGNSLKAQDATANHPYPKSIEPPVWVLMMDDPEANYFEAMKAYEEYWKTHPMPAEEEEEMEGALPEKGVSEKERRRQEREREEEKRKKLRGADLEVAEYLKFQNKRFKNWAREVKPWVQENGHILSDAERTEIWNKQQEELRKQEGK